VARERQERGWSNGYVVQVPPHPSLCPHLVPNWQFGVQIPVPLLPNPETGTVAE
jgi:hypothetical protein